jgi:beta-glucosidase
VVVVLLNGSALAVNWAQEHAAAILDAWYPGEDGGTAIAETLAGSNNPAGRLPVTFYKSMNQLPPFTDYSMQNRTYRYFQGEPLYGFGYGLSYSSFAFSNFHLSTNTVKAGQPLTVDADVKNTSSIAGDEVAELYLEYAKKPGSPLRALKGFKRIHLRPGETRRVSFTLDPRALSMATENGDRIVLPGSYTLFVGGSQPVKGAPGVSARLQISGRQKLSK